MSNRPRASSKGSNPHSYAASVSISARRGCPTSKEAPRIASASTAERRRRRKTETNSIFEKRWKDGNKNKM